VISPKCGQFAGRIPERLQTSSAGAEAIVWADSASSLGACRDICAAPGRRQNLATGSVFHSNCGPMIHRRRPRGGIACGLADAENRFRRLGVAKKGGFVGQLAHYPPKSLVLW